MVMLGVHSDVSGTEQWDVFEIVLKGPSDGNPFVDVTLSAEFTQGDKVYAPDGFYDGDGTYRIRFMPPTVRAPTPHRFPAFLPPPGSREPHGRPGPRSTPHW